MSEASNQLVRAEAEAHAREYLKTVRDEVLRPIDRGNAEAVLVGLIMAQPGGPRLRYSVTRVGEQYTIVAKGYTKGIDGLRFAETFIGRDRTNEMRSVTTFMMHPGDAALTVYMNSVEPEEESPRADSYGRTPRRPGGRGVY